MTRVHLKVKLHIVDPLFVGEKYRTDVWISETVRKKLKKFVKEDVGQRFVKKLKYYADTGFADFESPDGPIKHEWDDVWRVAHSSSMFRLIGFYHEGKSCFIAITAFMKRGQRLSAAERKRMSDVARVKKLGSWKRRRP